MAWARIIEQDGVQVVAEVVDFDPATKFLPDIAALFVEATEGMVYRARLIDDVWTAPPEPDPVTPPEPVTPVEQVQAEAAALSAKVKVDAEAERLKYITGGSGKAMTYLSKRQEVAHYRAVVAAAGTPDADDYPFASAEATTRGIALSAMIDTYEATSAAFVTLGAQIEAAEQGATVAIATASAAAIAALGEDPPDTDTAATQIAAMRAAAVVSWPVPS